MEFVSLGLVFFFEHSIYMINDNALLSYSKSELLTIAGRSDTLMNQMSFKLTKSAFVKNFGGQRRKKMNDKISIELSPKEWDLIMVSLKYKKTIIVTEKGLEETD